MNSALGRLISVTVSVLLLLWLVRRLGVGLVVQIVITIGRGLADLVAGILALVT